MAIQIDKTRFRQAHAVFLDHMRERGDGIHFTNFSHRFFVTDEVSYKTEALRRGREALSCDKWPRWINTLGKITQSLQEACKPAVSQNLMEHRYGEQKNSYSALYRLGSDDEVRSFERQVLALYQRSKDSEDMFGQEFDVFAEYLRTNQLGCKWDFLAYLLFLMRPERCFPIRSSHFERVLAFYGVTDQISGKVTWDRYRVILDSADALKEELLLYGTATSIEIQSYMWIVSRLLPKIEGREPPLIPFDFVAELRARQNKEMEKQRIGLLGERFVFETEQAKLIDAGRDDLAQKVRLVSVEDDTLGYDVLSFTVGGEERHLEVKATTLSEHDLDCFWLSANEIDRASKDPLWTVYRVWNVDDSAPRFEDIGNIVRSGNSLWQRAPSSWIVRRTATL